MKKSSLLISIFLVLLAGCLLLAVPYISRLDEQITDRFEGRRWELPARIYARPLELYVGKTITVAGLEKELIQLRYSRQDTPDKPGEYSIQAAKLRSIAVHFLFQTFNSLQPLLRLLYMARELPPFQTPAAKRW